MAEVLDIDDRMNETLAVHRTPADDNSRWRAVLARDSRADGQFVYGVRSTHIYCRPSCASRRPHRDRVMFFSSPVDAERAGYRACRRCRPSEAPTADPWVGKVRRACLYLARSDARPSLAALAQRLGGSPYHLQRNFKRLVGLTPRAYAEACRLGAVKRQLRKGDDVTSAVFGAGYGSSSRFYERAAPKLGMPPSTYQRGGAGMSIRYTIVDSALGRLLVAATARGVCAVAMAQSDADLQRDLAREYPAAAITAADASFTRWTAEVLARLSGRRPRIDLPLDVQATAFQWQVWQALAAIPFGETRTYGQVAAAIGRPSAARAVARACATNPVAVAIPCHRVVGVSGSLTGYRWGVERKKELLGRERQTSRANIPRRNVANPTRASRL
jgi:AraC family transcriptional regulator of adaptative response/methylated-DNA-[protein]-cysteine methyltransferase